MDGPFCVPILEDIKMIEAEVLSDVVEVSQKSASADTATWLDEIFVQKLRTYSKYILHRIVFDSNDDNERPCFRYNNGRQKNDKEQNC